MQRHDPTRHLNVMKMIGLDAAFAHEIADAHDLVVRTVGSEVASAEVMARIHNQTKTSVLLVRENNRVTGVLGELPLTAAGLAALKEQELEGTDPRPEFVAAPGEIVTAFYCWGLAAETRYASAVGVRGVIAARDEIYGDLPFYARAARAVGSADDQSNGARVAFRRFACVYDAAQPDLLYSPKSKSRIRSAA